MPRERGPGWSRSSRASICRSSLCGACWFLPSRSTRSHTPPMVVDMSTGFHFRPEGLGLLLAWNDPEETPGFKTQFDPAFVEKILTRGVDRVPCLDEAEVNPKRAWAGLYEMTPDHHPILGPVPGVPGL